MNNRIYLLAAFLLVLASCRDDRQGVSEFFPVRVGEGGQGKYGFIDRAGKTVIPNQFSKEGCFSEGLALVATMDAVPKWGFIDRKGHYTIDPVYTDATAFSDGIAFVTVENGGPTAIDKKGVVQFTLDDAVAAENFSEGLAAYSILGPDGELWGFTDKKGATLIPPSFRDVGYFSDGLCGVMNAQGKWGYVNKKGDVAIAYRYDNVFPFEDKKARVNYSGKWGVIDEQGNSIVIPQYEHIDIDGRNFLIKRGGKWGWINKDGKEIIPVAFDDAFPFRDNAYAAVKQGGKWGYIDQSGEWSIKPRFDFAFGVDGDLAAVAENKKYGFIEMDGSYVIKPVYSNISTDYFIRYFANTSAFYSIRTNKGLPANVAWKWLSHFYHLEYKDALRLSTPETKALLTQFVGLIGGIADSTRQRMAGLIIGVKDARENGDRAIVTYTLSDNPGKDELLFLVKQDGQWRVQFSKNDKQDTAAKK
jgi:hypothetical protein